jgi:outer membrane protein assembly complex protein YaeT
MDATMTPPCPRRLLALALASALAGPAWAQPATPSAQPAGSDSAVPPPPADAFVVGDIRIDGLQRISAGTVFTYLPVQRGDRLDATGAANAIRALYRTGFFEDVRLDRQGDILVVTVVERPAINKLTITGNKDIKTEDLEKGLSEIGLAEGRTFDRLALDRVTQELTRQYNDRGKYNVAITPTVSRLDRNRVNVTIAVNEGDAARIRHINLVGNETFTDKEITKGWESAESNWLSWYRRDDRYSREKLSGDLEKLNAHYLDRGYIDFNVDSSQVAISPDKQDIYITAGLTEGEQYTVSSVEVTGETVLPRQQVEALVLVQEGQIFSRRLLEVSSEQITAALGNIGYAFARVTPVPEVDRDARTVGIALQVEPGPRVNVRRIQFKGNTRTADEVLRREMRQFEGAWYSQAAIDRSKIRLQRLGYFETVEIETPAVPGSQDQVDLVVNVKETTSGSFTFGLGYSQLSGLTTSVQLSQLNFLGSGNRINVQAQRNDYVQRYDFSFVNPYFTDEGMSLGYNLWWREFDNADFNVAQYSSTSGAAQMVLGLPITETDTVSALFGIHLPRLDAAGDRRLHRRARHPDLPCLAHRARLGARHPQRLLRAHARHVPADLGRGHPARLDRRVLQDQLRILPVLAAEPGAGAQHPCGTGVRRQLRRRDDPRHLLHPAAAGDRGEPHPRGAATQRPLHPGDLAGLHQDRHRGRPAVLRELLRRRRAFDPRLPRQHRRTAGRTAFRRPARPLARWCRQDGGLGRDVLPPPARQPGCAGLGLRRLRQRVHRPRRLRCQHLPRLDRRGTAVAGADRADHDQLCVSAAHPGRGRDRTPAVHLRRRVLTGVAGRGP